MKKKTIQKILASDPRNRAKEILDTPVPEAFVKNYIGKIEDNNDPDKLGRCKVRVFGVFGDEINTDDLPWAIPENGFVGSKIGSFIVPNIDTVVRVYFDQNNIYSPIYTTKVLDITNQSTRKDEDYPDTMVMFETDEGEYHIVNRKQSTTEYHCANGLYVQVDSEGNLLLDSSECETGEIRLQDKNGNILAMTSEGLKYNDVGLVTENFLKDLLSTYAAKLTLTTAPGSPSPIEPSTLSDMILKKDMASNIGGFLTKGKS
jgi:hypothetical protein